MASDVISDLLRKERASLLDAWLQQQLQAPNRRALLLREQELKEQSREVLQHLIDAIAEGDTDLQSPGFEPVRQLLSRISASRAAQGFSPSETATFVFSLKQPIFTLLRRSLAGDALADELWRVSTLLDQLGLFTTEAYQKAREEVISRQQRDMLELSTPVVQLWKGILALPLIGTLDSARSQTVMESLLERIVEEAADIAIIDITGVPTVDTLTAQHLIRTVTATRLMGADCIISGIRPQIAQTIVHLGVDLGDITTKATLAGAFALALQRTGRAVTRQGKPEGAAAERPAPASGKER